MSESLSPGHDSVPPTHGQRAEKFYELCSTKIPEAVISAIGTTPDVFHFLSIGSGMGDPDIRLLTELRKRYSKIKATILEPSPDMIAAFKENLRKEGPLLDDVEFVWNTMTLDEYMENEQPKQHFHCIFMVGVIFYFKDLTKSMKYLYNALDKTGLIVISDHSAKAPFLKITQEFPILFNGLRLRPTDDVITDFIEYHECSARCTVFEMKATLNIMPCMQEDSETGNLILDLLTHVVKFRETAPKDLVDDFMKFLTSPGLVLHRSSDEVAICNSRDVILVQRPTH